MASSPPITLAREHADNHDGWCHEPGRAHLCGTDEAWEETTNE